MLGSIVLTIVFTILLTFVAACIVFTILPDNTPAWVFIIIGIIVCILMFVVSAYIAAPEEIDSIPKNWTATETESVPAEIISFESVGRLTSTTYTVYLKSSDGRAAIANISQSDYAVLLAHTEVSIVSVIYSGNWLWMHQSINSVVINFNDTEITPLKFEWCN